MNTRQPIHVLYGGAHLFRHDVAAKMGRIAQKALEEHHPLLPVTPAVLERIRNKLQREPVEDLRIDFEDGYGYRSEEEEDGHARNAAQEVARGMQEGTLPPFLGIRIKSFSQQARPRSLRTLRIFFEHLPNPPVNFCVTLPKITTVEEVEALCRSLDDLQIPSPIELMIETPQALRNVRALVEAAGARCRGAHFGPYDFCSACGVTVQDLRHRLCVHARNEILVALADTEVWLADGPTSVLPTGSAPEIDHAWRISWTNIEAALTDGYYQGWDLHPAQLPVRYAAVYSYFAEMMPHALKRYRNYIDQLEQATRVGTAFDDAATIQILKNLFARAEACGATDEAP